MLRAHRTTETMYIRGSTLVRALRKTLSEEHRDSTHMRWTLILVASTLTLRGIVSAFRALDYLVFTGFRQQKVAAPIFVTGNPRSGTTFLHRLLAMDDQFTSTKLYHTIFPSVTLYKLIDLIARVDALLGGHAGSILNRIDRRSFRGWEGIHRTRLAEWEEDEQLFVYSFMSPVLTLLFPFLRELRELAFADELPVQARKRLMNDYRLSLQRHIHACGDDRILLQKNTSLAGRLRMTIEEFPDIRIVHIIRHPYDAIASLLSMYAVTWRRLAPRASKEREPYRRLAALFCEYYRYRARLLRELSPDQLVELTYDDLLDDPERAVLTVYRQFGLRLSEEYQRLLEAETKKAHRYRSRHRYTLRQFGLSERDVYALIPDVFDMYGFKPEPQDRRAVPV